MFLKSFTFRAWASLVFAVCLLIIAYGLLFEQGKYALIPRHRESESGTDLGIYTTNQTRLVYESNSTGKDGIDDILQMLSENEDDSSEGSRLKTTESPTPSTSKSKHKDLRLDQYEILAPPRRKEESHDELTGKTLTTNPSVQVVIVTAKRSGSSFVGELFNANPHVFYLYEPLYIPMKSVLDHTLKNDQFTRIAKDVWNHTLRCNFSDEYPSSRSWLNRGEKSFDSCKSNAAIKGSSVLCPVLLIPEPKIGSVLNDLCNDRPYTVLKTIRVQNISELKTFIEDPGLNVKILHLVRDPRAVMNSRWSLKQPNKDLLRRKGPRADEVLDLCDHMQRNIAFDSSTPEWLKDRYIRVRFEDLAQDPIGETKRIYGKLGMQLHDNVISWIKKNTQGVNNIQGNKDPFSRTRDTKKVVDSWRSKLDSRKIKRIESSCWKTMDALSYTLSSLKTEQEPR
ncbi:carbohydrate sulfotransferase 1 [Strongylocentrotus purpuratus]|uniref:Sulfotransferase n=1 Tax=Strongylocentrotus purpuratus TaxID=7668 RepID=A0A7M7LL30_STRPU|nr:carbohydrate sulfotransferase 1 [Strongylocentrotus purpuratus]XP_011681278.2 carbohydrate sulfotransferase 1 [Strongylocentrotus purpuratus]